MGEAKVGDEFVEPGRERRTDMDRHRLAGQVVTEDADERTGDARDAVTGEVGSAHLREPSELEGTRESDGSDGEDAPSG
jgi:hypothetical protein